MLWQGHFGKLSNLEVLQWYWCPCGCLRETRENTDVKKAIATSVTPGKGREGELCSMKLAEKVNVEAKSTRVPIRGTRHYL